MANYTISKRSNKNGNVYSVRVRVRIKEKNIVTFSKSKSFHSKVAATQWAKKLIHKVEKNLDDLNLTMMDCTLGELIETYIKRKQLYVITT